MLFTQNIRLTSTASLLLLVIFLFGSAHLIHSSEGTANAAVSEVQNLNLSINNSSFSSPDTLETFYGTVKFEMKDGSYVTPFGVDVILKEEGSVVESVSTNNSGRYYLKDVEYGRYEMTVQHKNSTVYTDSLIITSSTSKNLGDVIIDMQN